MIKQMNRLKFHMKEKITKEEKGPLSSIGKEDEELQELEDFATTKPFPST